MPEAEKREEVIFWILHKIIEINCFSANIRECNITYITHFTLTLNPIRPELFWSSWAWGGGGGASKAPLHKSESIDAIDMKLGG